MRTLQPSSRTLDHRFAFLAATTGNNARKCDERDGAWRWNCSLFEDEFNTPLLTESRFAHFKRDSLRDQKPAVGRVGSAALAFAFILLATAPLAHARAAAFTTSFSAART